MEKSRALSFVASTLALDAYDFIETAEKLPNLTQLRDNALRERQQVAEALGIGKLYQARLNNLKGA